MNTPSNHENRITYSFVATNKTFTKYQYRTH